jgi:hypothetical protein
MNKKHQNLLTEKDQIKLYWVHHMHHLKTDKGGVAHELHHCFLYSQKNEKGEKYRIKHLMTKGKLLHVLQKPFSGKLYDHLNYPLKMTVSRIGKKEHSILNLK